MKVIVIDGFNLTTTTYTKVLEMQTIYNDGVPELLMNYSLIIVIIHLNENGDKVKKSFNPHSDMSFIVQEENT